MVLEAIGAFAALAAVLQTREASARGKKDRKLGALSALSDAVAATTKALMARRKQKVPDPTLANLWRQAAIALEGAGERKLARLCKTKGVYWLNPSKWKPEEVHTAGIQLQSMERELRRLLGTATRI